MRDHHRVEARLHLLRFLHAPPTAAVVRRASLGEDAAIGRDPAILPDIEPARELLGNRTHAADANVAWRAALRRGREGAVLAERAQPRPRPNEAVGLELGEPVVEGGARRGAHGLHGVVDGTAAPGPRGGPPAWPALASIVDCALDA